MDEISLREYIELLAQRKRTIAAVTLAVVLVVGVVLIFTPRVYEGKASILFPQPSEGISSQFAQIAGLLPTGMQSFSSSSVYITILNSRTINSGVREALRLDRYDVKLKDLQDNLDLQSPREGGLIVTCRVPTSWLRGHVPRRELARRTADLAARVANTYIDELYRYDKSNNIFMGKRNRLFIERQLETTKADLARAEARLQQFQEAHPTLVPPDKSSEYADQALQLVAQQTQTDIAMSEIVGELDRAHTTWKAGAPSKISPEAVIDSPAIANLRQQLADLEVRRATLLEDFTETHPDVVSLTQKIEKTYEQIRAEVGDIVKGKASSVSPAHQELLKQLVLLEINRDGIQARKSALAGAMADIESRLSGLPKEEIEYTRLLRQVRATETVYSTLLTEYAKAKIAEDRDSGAFIVLDSAVTPEKPAKPRVALTLAAALMIGLILGVVTATLQGARL